jgi:hypothetical protein
MAAIVDVRQAAWEWASAAVMEGQPIPAPSPSAVAAE